MLVWGIIYDPKELPGVSTAGLGLDGVLHGPFLNKPYLILIVRLRFDSLGLPPYPVPCRWAYPVSPRLPAPSR
jgi:hypothetical protein